jgi:hypothetical protein
LRFAAVVTRAGEASALTLGVMAILSAAIAPTLIKQKRASQTVLIIAAHSY